MKKDRLQLFEGAEGREMNVKKINK